KVVASDVTPPRDDYASTTSTTRTVSVGGSTPFPYTTLFRSDWFKITLTAGHTYQFDLKGSPSGNGTLADPFLRLRDSAGNPITNTVGAHVCTPVTSRFRMAFSACGTYILSTGSSTASGTGTY